MMKIEVIQMDTGVSVEGELFIHHPLTDGRDGSVRYAMDRRSESIANWFRSTPSVDFKIDLKEVYESGASWFDGVYIRRIDK